MTDWFDAGGSGQRVDVVALLDSAELERLAEMVSWGAMVSLGLTSDGGALGLTITVDGKWRREYVRDAEQLSLFMETAAAPVKEACERRAASAEQRTRTRGLRGR